VKIFEENDVMKNWSKALVIGSTSFSITERKDDMMEPLQLVSCVCRRMKQLHGQDQVNFVAPKQWFPITRQKK